MPTIMVRADARAAMSEDKKEALRHVGVLVSLGEPAFYLDADGVEWCVYDDHRFTAEDAARGGRIVANASTFPDFSPVGKSRGEIHAEDVRFANAKAAKMPQEIPHTEGADRFTEVWNAQGPPAWAKMANSLPMGWIPKGV